MSQDVTGRIREAVLSCDDGAIVAAAEAGIKAGFEPVEIATALTNAIRELGQMWQRDEVFLPEVMLAAEGLKKAMEAVQAQLPPGMEIRKEGKVLLGSVKGDIHTIGKDLVGTLLSISGFDVYDIGIDIPPAQFVNEAVRVNADIIAASALMTTTILSQADLVSVLKQKGLRDRFKVIVGGGAVTKEWADRIGADGYGADAVEAVEVAKALLAARTA